MPQIAEYDAPPGALHPSEIAEQAYQREGYMSARLGNERASMLRQAGTDQEKAAKEVGAGLDTLGAAVEKHESQQEIIGGFQKLSDLGDRLSKNYDDTVNGSDPFDTTISQRWREQVMDPEIEQFSQGFNTPAGKEWAAMHAAEFATHMHRQTIAEDANRAGNATVLGLVQATNSLGNMAARNPAMTDAALSMVPGTIDAYIKQGNLSPEWADKIRKEGEGMQKVIAQAGLRSRIRNNPADGIAALDSGKYDQFVTPAEDEQLRGFAEHMTKAKELDAAGAEKRAQKEEDNTLKQNLTSLQQSTITDKGDVAYPADFQKNLTDISMTAAGMRHPETIKAMSEYGQRLQAEQAKQVAAGEKAAGKSAMQTTDPAQMDQVIAGAASGNLTHSQLLGMVGKGLSASDGQWLSLQTSDDQKTDLGTLKDTLDQAKATLAGADPGSRTDAGMAAYGRAQTYIISAFRKGQAAGLTASQMLSPDSKDYILRDNKLQAIAAQSSAVLPKAGGALTFPHPFHMIEGGAGKGAELEGADADETKMLASIRERESSGDYNAQNAKSTASGAYQMIDSTWREASHATGRGTQYAHAKDAPGDIQDANALWLLRNRGTGQWAASSRPTLGQIFGGEQLAANIRSPGGGVYGGMLERMPGLIEDDKIKNQFWDNKDKGGVPINNNNLIPGSPGGRPMGVG